MPKSSRTREEFNTVAMLMGPQFWYDFSDHTICEDMGKGQMRIYDADTMEAIDITQFMATLQYEQRRKAVMKQELGCADGPFMEAVTR